MMFKQKLFLSIYLFIFWLSHPTKIMANSHALLVGIGNYPTLEKLEGPPHDVNALFEVLTQHWKFEPSNVTRLLNKKATKKNILTALKALSDKSRPGDQLFIYFSGHGTSYYDDKLNTNLPTSTGAFLPYDVNLTNANTTWDSLIIGKRDLRPILKKIDNKKVSVFVTMDACFSGNTVRESKSSHHLPTRYIAIPNNTMATHSKKIPMEKQSKSNALYPYESVYYLSASSEFEVAQEIPARFLAYYPTIDGLPHGAFTDSLLYALLNPRLADTNKDAMLLHTELKDFISHRMSARGFNHSPNALPDITTDNQIPYKPLFGRSLRNINMKAAHTYALSQTPFQEKVLKSRAISNATEYTNTFEQAFTSNVSELDFSISNIETNRHQLFLGETAGFSVTTKQPAFLLIFNIDASGKTNILYPYLPNEVVPLSANITHQFADFIQARKPLGTDTIYALALKNWSSSLDAYLKQTFRIDSKIGANFLQTLTNSKEIISKKRLTIKILSKQQIPF